MSALERPRVVSLAAARAGATPRFRRKAAQTRALRPYSRFERGGLRRFGSAGTVFTPFRVW